MAGWQDLVLHVGSGRLEASREPARVLDRQDGVDGAGEDEHRLSPEFRLRRLGEGHHRTNQGSAGEGFRPQQQHRGRDVRAIGEAERHGRGQPVGLTGLADEIRQLLRTLAQIGLVEDAFRKPAKEAGHASFEHLAARRQQRRSRRHHPPKREKVVLVASRPVEKQDGRPLRPVSRLEADDEGRGHSGRHSGHLR
jgi:hypothetical protein